MSLGDYLRLLRAKGGGLTPWDIEAATTLPKGLYRQMEQRYRAIGDDASIQILAEYYAVPFEDLRWRLDWSRKALSPHSCSGNQSDADHARSLERARGGREGGLVGFGCGGSGHWQRSAPDCAASCR